MDPAAVWVTIPAYNEEAIIASVVDPLSKLGFQVVVVDDCSDDQTVARLAELPVHFLSHPVNLGQGAALQTAISYALSQQARYIVTFDADGQHSPTDISKLLDPLIRGEFDVALGSRFIAGGSAENIPPIRRSMLRLAILLSRFSTGMKLTDTHNGLRAFTADAARKLKITQNRMAHASQILSQISSQKLRYVEVPVRIVYTDYSMQKGQRVSNAFNVVWESLMAFFHL